MPSSFSTWADEPSPAKSAPPPPAPAPPGARFSAWADEQPSGVTASPLPAAPGATGPGTPPASGPPTVYGPRNPDLRSVKPPYAPAAPPPAAATPRTGPQILAEEPASLPKPLDVYRRQPGTPQYTGPQGQTVDTSHLASTNTDSLAQAGADLRDLLLGPAYGNPLKAASTTEKVLNGVLRATASISTPESIALWLTGVGVAAQLPKLAETVTGARILSQNPRLRNAVDIVTRNAVPLAFGTQQTAVGVPETIQGIQAGDPERTTQGLASLALGGAGLYAGARGMAETAGTREALQTRLNAEETARATAERQATARAPRLAAAGEPSPPAPGTPPPAPPPVQDLGKGWSTSPAISKLESTIQEAEQQAVSERAPAPASGVRVRPTSPVVPVMPPSPAAEPAGAQGTAPQETGIQAPPREQTAEEQQRSDFYAPGNIIYTHYWHKYDRVLESWQATDRPQGDWGVLVQESDKYGNPVPGTEPRWHRTQPDPRDKIVGKVQAQPVTPQIAAPQETGVPAPPVETGPPPNQELPEQVAQNQPIAETKPPETTTPPQDLGKGWTTPVPEVSPSSPAPEAEAARVSGAQEPKLITARPSLGTTGRDIYQGWKALTETTSPPRATIEGYVPGTGRFDFRNGKIVRLQTESTRRGNVSTYRDATPAEIGEIHDAIDRGQFQVEQRTIRGALGVRQFSDAGALEKVFHQATGRPLPEFLGTKEGQDWARRTHYREEPPVQSPAPETITKPEDSLNTALRNRAKVVAESQRQEQSPEPGPVIFGKPGTYSGTIRIEARSGDPIYGDRVYLEKRKGSKEWSVRARDYETLPGEKFPAHLEQTIASGLTLKQAKALSQQRLQSGETFDRTRPAYHPNGKAVTLPPRQQAAGSPPSHSLAPVEAKPSRRPTQRGSFSRKPNKPPQQGTIEELSAAIGEHGAPERPSSEKVTTVGDARERVKEAVDKFKGSMKALGKAYTNPRSSILLPASGKDVSDYERALGHWSGADNRAAFLLYRFRKAAEEAVPSPAVREAMTNWIQAGGDDKLLAQRAADSRRGLKTHRYAKGYEDAQHLTQEEKHVAKDIIGYNDRVLRQMQEAGILSEGVVNYVTQLYEKEPVILNKVMAQANLDGLMTRPYFVNKRTFESYFDAEQAGFKPRNKDVFYLAAAHDRALQEALAAREFVKRLKDGEASDGRPLAITSWATAREVPAENEPGKALMISPNTSKEGEFADYLPLDHPALRGWRWAAEDSKGQSIVVKGDVLVHPEIHRHLKNNLSKGGISNFSFEAGGQVWKPGERALRINAGLKHAIFMLSRFHETTLESHALEHRTNPWNLVDLDMQDPNQRALINGGLMVAHYEGMDAFSEGLTGPNLRNVPGIGPFLHGYVDHLFKEKIPALAMNVGLHALERNRARYAGQFTDAKIAQITAKQMNAAFGTINYRLLGRNRTLQETLRLLFMAPQFLEGRAKFVAQAFRPQGREQLWAYLLGAAGFLTLAQVANILVNGKPDWEDPFAAKIFGKIISMRSVQEDTWQALTETGRFLHNRLGPPASFLHDYIGSKNIFGGKQTLGQGALEAARRNVPIPVQPWTRTSKATVEERIAETILRAIGINIRNPRVKAAPAGRPPARDPAAAMRRRQKQLTRPPR